MSTSNVQVCPNCGAPYERAGNETQVTCKFCGTVISLAPDTSSLTLNALPTASIGPEATKWIRYFIIFIVVVTVCPLLIGVCGTIVSVIAGFVGIAIPFIVR